MSQHAGGTEAEQGIATVQGTLLYISGDELGAFTDSCDEILLSGSVVSKATRTQTLAQDIVGKNVPVEISSGTQ